MVKSGTINNKHLIRININLQALTFQSKNQIEIRNQKTGSSLIQALIKLW